LYSFWLPLRLCVSLRLCVKSNADQRVIHRKPGSQHQQHQRRCPTELNQLLILSGPALVASKAKPPQQQTTNKTAEVARVVDEREAE
jgi:hypothetical protein